MIGYIVRRILQSIVVIVVAVAILFLISQWIPGGQARAALGPKAQPHAIARFNRVNGLDDPFFVQLWHYMWALVRHFQLGYSYHYNEGVKQVISDRLPRTLSLVGVGTVFALIVAVPLGILQVVRRNKISDYVLTGLSFLFYAMPAFLLGTLLLLFFSFYFKLFPVQPPYQSGFFTIFADPRAFVLPVLTLAALTVASFSRYMRSSMMDALTQDYVRTARAKGASNRRVLYGHALRNALIPILTLIGLSLPNIVGGALITETVFNYPGMGLLTVQAAQNDDVPVVIGTTVVITIATVVGSLLADILYAVADPRIRLGDGST